MERTNAAGDGAHPTPDGEAGSGPGSAGHHPATNATLPNATHPTLRFLGCNEIRIGVELPRSNLEAVVPPAFEVLSWNTPATGLATLILNECERAATDQSVMTSSTLYRVLVEVRPKNASWHTEDWRGSYLLDVASDNPALVEAMNNQSMGALNATISRTALPPVQDVWTTHWNVDTGSWSATFDYSRVPFSPQTLEWQAYHWFGTGPYVRATFLRTHLADSFVSAGALLLEGDSRLGRAVPGGVAPYGAGSSSDVEIVYQFDGEWSG